MTVIRFQADGDHRQAIVTGAVCGQHNLDNQSANEALLEGVKNPEGLTIAAWGGRMLVMDVRITIAAEFGQFIIPETSSGALIFLRALQSAMRPMVVSSCGKRLRLRLRKMLHNNVRVPDHKLFCLS